MAPINRESKPYFAWFLMFFVIVVGGPGQAYFWLWVQLAIATATAGVISSAVRSLLWPSRTVAATTTKEPVTTADLKSWLFRHTHEKLPAQEQPHDFYRALYEKHRGAAARPPPPPVHAAATGAVGALSFSNRQFGTMVACGCIQGALAAAIIPPGWTLLRVAPFLADWISGLSAVSMPTWLAMLLLSPRWVPRALGAATGAWIAGSEVLAPQAGSRPARWTSLASWATAVSLSAELHAPVLISMLARLVIKSLGLVGFLLLTHPLLLPTLLLLAPAVAAAMAFTRGSRPAITAAAAAASTTTTTRLRMARRQRVLFIGVCVGLSVTALQTNGHLGHVASCARDLAHGEWRPAYTLVSDACSYMWAAAFPRRPPTAPHPPVESERDAEVRACAALGVEVGAELSEIKAAHRKLVLEHHPDKAQGRGASADEVAAAEKRFREVQDAYDTLSAIRGK